MPLLGSREDRDVVISANGVVMIYGDAGAGKTTLQVDLIAHLAAGVDWHGIKVPKPVRQVVIENEGDRAEFRMKLELKLDSWQGDDFDAMVDVLDEPWGAFTLDDTAHVDELAAFVREHDVDLVWMGPGVEIGMKGAGTPDDVKLFESRLRELRGMLDRPLAVGIPHHENKGGDISGAWGRWPATVIRVEGEKRTTKLTFRKARHSSMRQSTTVVLAWADNESYTLVETDTTGPRKAPAEAIAIWIRGPECGGRATPKQIREQFDIGDTTLRDRREDLANLGIDYRQDGRESEYLDRDVYPAIAGSPDETHPDPHPTAKRGVTKTRGQPNDNPVSPPRTPRPRRTEQRGVRKTL